MFCGRSTQNNGECALDLVQPRCPIVGGQASVCALARLREEAEGCRLGPPSAVIAERAEERRLGAAEDRFEGHAIEDAKALGDLQANGGPVADLVYGLLRDAHAASDLDLGPMLVDELREAGAEPGGLGRGQRLEPGSTTATPPACGRLVHGA